MPASALAQSLDTPGTLAFARATPEATPNVSSLDPQRLLRLLYRQLAALAGRRHDLDDLVQAAAERALRSLGRFRGECAWSTWTYAIAYRTFLDHERWYRRYLRRFRASAEELVLETPAQTDVARDSHQGARSRALYAALERLPPKKRAVVVLFELEGFTAGEVSAIVGASEGTVRSRLRDGRARLLALLGQDPLFQKDSP